MPSIALAQSTIEGRVAVADPASCNVAAYDAGGSVIASGASDATGAYSRQGPNKLPSVVRVEATNCAYTSDGTLAPVTGGTLSAVGSASKRTRVLTMNVTPFTTVAAKRYANGRQGSRGVKIANQDASRGLNGGVDVLTTDPASPLQSGNVAASSRDYGYRLAAMDALSGPDAGALEYWMDRASTSINRGTLSSDMVSEMIRGVNRFDTAGHNPNDAFAALALIPLVPDAGSMDRLYGAHYASSMWTSGGFRGSFDRVYHDQRATLRMTLSAREGGLDSGIGVDTFPKPNVDQVHPDAFICWKVDTKLSGSGKWWAGPKVSVNWTGDAGSDGEAGWFENYIVENASDTPAEKEAELLGDYFQGTFLGETVHDGSVYRHFRVPFLDWTQYYTIRQDYREEGSTSLSPILTKWLADGMSNTNFDGVKVNIETYGQIDGSFALQTYIPANITPAPPAAPSRGATPAKAASACSIANEKARTKVRAFCLPA